ncbi:MAG: hypothetical protein QG671_229 [Actinomycetota bacterium]|nr:hypothetical protein [Actinomycetota bacterium]
MRRPRGQSRCSFERGRLRPHWAPGADRGGWWSPIADHAGKVHGSASSLAGCSGWWPTPTPRPLHTRWCVRASLERVTRIELALSAWEADVLPLNYTRVAVERLHRHRRGTQRHQRKVCRSSPPGASGGSAITPAERADRRATPGHVPTRGHAGLRPAEAFPPLLRRCPDRDRRRGRRVPWPSARRSDRWSRGLQ